MSMSMAQLGAPIGARKGSLHRTITQYRKIESAIMLSHTQLMNSVQFADVSKVPVPFSSLCFEVPLWSRV